MDSFNVRNGMSRSWYSPVMTEEKQDELIREYQEILSKLAACSAELKRIGESFKQLGTNMIDPPEVLAIDQASFNADVALTPVLIVQYSELAAKKSDKQAELEKFGPLPQFAA
jgi:hypothetical protein